MITACIQQVEIPSDRMGLLSDFPGDPSDGHLLQAHLEEHGYVLLRGALDVEEVVAARAEVFGRLAEMGEVADPPLEAIATGISRRPDPAQDAGVFWTSVSEGSSLRRLTHGPRINGIMDVVIGETARESEGLKCRHGVIQDKHSRVPNFAQHVDALRAKFDDRHIHHRVLQVFF